MKDQVGNLRLAFRTRGRTARDIEDSFEPDQGRSAKNQPQVEHENETRYRAPLLARTGEHVALVNARDAQHRVGPALTVPVQAGDSVYASVYARIEPPLPRPWFAPILTGPESEATDATKNSRRLRFWPRLGLNLAPWLLQQTHRTTTTGQVYMRVQTLNEQQQVLSEERFYVDPTVSPTQWQYLLAKLAAAQSGYVRVELVNESGDNAYFDDLQVRLVNDLIQENHYDPFGLNLAELEVKGDPDCKYQFNGKEKQEDFGLGWNDHGARNLDTPFGRWLSVDPLAEERYDWSPYQFGRCNPLRNWDPTGKLDHWVEGVNGDIYWRNEVTSAKDKDLKLGETYLGANVLVGTHNRDASGNEPINTAKFDLYLERNKDGVTATIYGNTVPADTKKYPTLAEGQYAAESSSRASYVKKGLEDKAILIGNGGELPTVKGNPQKGGNTMSEIFFHMGNNSRASLSTLDGGAISAGCQTSGSYPGSRQTHNEFMREVGPSFKGAYYLRSKPSFIPAQLVPFSSDLTRN